MTPQLQQAIRLLQFSAPDLIDYVDNELESNPLLERDESSADSALSEAIGNADDRPDNGMPLVDSVDEQSDAPLDIDDAMTGNDTAFDTKADAPVGVGDASTWTSGRGLDEGLPDLAQTLSEDQHLRTYLEQQLNLSVKDPAERIIGTALIDSLDDSGYLATDISSIADQLGATEKNIEKVLLALQAFDPPGLFARDLQECLALQLKDRDRYDPAMATLVANLNLLASRELTKLLELCGVDWDDLKDMIAEVRALDPKPGLRFESAISQTVIPDVIMTPSSEGGWRVELNGETLPRVLVNNNYYAELSQTAANETEKTFVAEKFQSATWLVRALEQRATTILKVATALVAKQDAFFSKGITHLRPLILRDIAEDVEMHESTVSRVTANKYMATPRGIYELKYFFSQALANDSGGEGTSAEAVRYKIKKMIDEEAVDNILSDDRIVELLRADGISVARRTVAKYRDSLKIRSSVQRRREKARDLPMS